VRLLPSASEFGIVAVARKQLVMTAIFGNFGVSNNCNVIGALHRRQAMRNDNNCATSHQTLKCVLDFSLGAWVKIRSRFVKHEHSRVDECGASKSDQLTLACRQTTATFANFSI
jgi:hypothetical protein